MGYTHHDAISVTGSGGFATGAAGSESVLAAAVLNGSATFDPGNILDGDEVATDITVTGAALGDFVLVSFSLDVQDLTLTADVTAANTVTAVFANNTGGAVDLASGTVAVRVIQ